MATRMRGAPQQELDIRQIITEAQARWLRPLEVCEILRNYQKYNFKLNPVPPNKPGSGSLFLFDRKTLRYFRKDGHNWRKKKDGKTVREAHERLKAGSIDVLHCYYAHGEEDPAFQRRSYWMLEGAYEHIVLVHYLEVQSARSTAYRPASTSTPPLQMTSPENLETGSSLSAEVDDVDSGDEVEEIPPPGKVSGHQPSLLHQISLPKDWSSILSSVNGAAETDQEYPVLDDDIDLEELLKNPDVFLGTKPLAQTVTLDTNGWNGLLQETPKNEASGWQEILEQCTTPSTRKELLGSVKCEPKVEDDAFFLDTPRGIAEALSPRGLGREPQSVLEAQLRAATEENALKSAQQYSANRRWQEPSRLSMQIGADEGRVFQQMGTQQTSQQMPQQMQTSGYQQFSDSWTNPQQPAIISNSDELQKMDSFGRWFIKQVGEDSPGALVAPYSESGSYWTLQDESTTAESSAQMQLDVNVILSHVQRFSITDFSPDHCVADEETKVLISGKFLEAVHNPFDYKWCCMFGDVEVPAEVINVGVLRCSVPRHAPGRIPFYVTCSDRLACSEVREFHIRPKQELEKERNDKEMLMQVRLARLLLKSEQAQREKQESSQYALEDCSMLEETIKKHTLSHLEVKEKLLDIFFKHRLEAWLSSRRDDVSVRDEHGQGVLHMVAALGYDWAVKMVIEAGVLPDFRDGRGWAALHWAALFGREKTVLKLLALGASPGPVTDPTTKHPSGQMPSELAAGSGHKGIAGFLAEKAVTSMLTSLNIAEKSEFSNMSAALAGESAVQDLGERNTGDDRESLQRSLSAVRNATQAAALIHSAYRQDSFRKRNALAEGNEEVDEYGMALKDIQAIQRLQRSNPKVQSSAALQIQRKFRGWKGRKDYLNLRKHVVRIQAHVRGHQARKHFKKIIWVVGVLEKAVLRWRRRGAGLRGFRAEENANGASSDDEDFLRESRKQKEQVLEKAVTRVQSMARSEEGRKQYRRMQERLQTEEQQQRASSLFDDDGAADEMMTS